MGDGQPRLNLVWGILEGFHGGAALGSRKRGPLSQVPFPAVRFTNMLCAAPSTTMSLIGLLSGTYPIYLRGNHLSKGAADPNDWRSRHPNCLPFLLDRGGYQKVFISWVKRFGETAPIFPDHGEGLTDELIALNSTLDSIRGGYDEPLQSVFWLPEVTQARIRSVLGAYEPKGPGAFVLHALCEDDLLCFFSELARIGVDHRNSVMVVVGDHGWPRNLWGLQQRRPDLIDGRVTHDTDLDEANIRVVGFVGHPDIAPRTVDAFTSALDLHATVVRLLGLQDRLVPGETESRDLVALMKGAPAVAHSENRILRIDNRYLDQRNNRITALVSKDFRYIVRPTTDWGHNRFYKYRLEEFRHREELYARSDSNEERNLARHPAYRGMLEEFRACYRRTESRAIASHHRDDLFAHHHLEAFLPWNRSSGAGRSGPGWISTPGSDASMLKAAAFELEALLRQGVTVVGLCGDPAFVDWLSNRLDIPAGLQAVRLPPEPAAAIAARVDGLLACGVGLAGGQLSPALAGLSDTVPVRSVCDPIVPTVGELRRLAPFVRVEDHDRFLAGTTILYGTGSLAERFLSTPVGRTLTPRIAACSVTVPAGPSQRWRTWPVVDPYRIAEMDPGQVVIASSFLGEIAPFLQSITDGLRLFAVEPDGSLDPRPLDWSACEGC
jgi:hypothetical protein